MARKPSDIVKPNLRIREDLRRRLELAAKKRGVSLNIEMTSRLKESFEREELLKLSKITSNLESNLERYARWMDAHLLQEDLMQAAESLISRLPVEIRDREAIQEAVERVQEAIKLAAAKGVGRIPINEPWEKN